MPDPLIEQYKKVINEDNSNDFINGLDTYDALNTVAFKVAKRFCQLYVNEFLASKCLQKPQKLVNAMFDAVWESLIDLYPHPHQMPDEIGDEDILSYIQAYAASEFEQYSDEDILKVINKFTSDPNTLIPYIKLYLQHT